MNIDFHYGVIYVVARWAGMEPSQAQLVAHACQYIDDSTVDGVIRFRDGQSFDRFATAHKMLDYRNLVDADDRQVWAAFHFLPAGEGATFDDKCVCRPDSLVARQMVRRALQRADASNALHRLGVALHVYVDTWAHQGFSGIISDRNVIHHLDVIHELDGAEFPVGTWREKLAAAFGKGVDTSVSELVDLLSKVGHGAALHFPDQPWAKWSYVNALGEHIKRDNLPGFVEAADNASRVIRAFLRGQDDFQSQAGLTAGQKAALTGFLHGNRSDHPAERLDRLGEALAQGRFIGLDEPLPTYVGKGAGSWKEAALGIRSSEQHLEQAEETATTFVWSQAFEASDYRKYHDAVQEHRYVVTREILPSHGVRLV